MSFLKLVCVLVLITALKSGYSQVHPDTLKNAYSASLQVINDNYMGRWLPGVKGNYFGPDDFLTVSLLSRIYYQNWKYSISYSVVTSRKFEYRYDLLSFVPARNFNILNSTVRIGAGFIYKENLGGQEFQNGFHRLGNVNEVILPYSKKTGLGLILETHIGKKYLISFINSDYLIFSLGSRLITDFTPSRISASGSYQAQISENLQLEIYIAYRFYLNRINDYSEMVRSGLIPGINVKYNFYRDWFVDIGFILIPSKNVMSDPFYDIYRRHYLPQAWLAFSFASAWKSLAEHLDY